MPAWDVDTRLERNKPYSRPKVKLFDRFLLNRVWCTTQFFADCWSEPFLTYCSLARLLRSYHRESGSRRSVMLPLNAQSTGWKMDEEGHAHARDSIFRIWICSLLGFAADSDFRCNSNDRSPMTGRISERSEWQFPE